MSGRWQELTLRQEGRFACRVWSRNHYSLSVGQFSAVSSSFATDLNADASKVWDGRLSHRLKSVQMGCETNGHVRVNQYALVSYVQAPLGSFLDRLRLRLTPECRPHAHITILPPRPLCAPEERAEAEIRDILAR